MSVVILGTCPGVQDSPVVTIFSGGFAHSNTTLSGKNEKFPEYDRRLTLEAPISWC